MYVRSTVDRVIFRWFSLMILAHLSCFLFTFYCGLPKGRYSVLIMFKFPTNSTILGPKIDTQINYLLWEPYQLKYNVLGP